MRLSLSMGPQVAGAWNTREDVRIPPTGSGCDRTVEFCAPRDLVAQTCQVNFPVAHIAGHSASADINIPCLFRIHFVHVTQITVRQYIHAASYLIKNSAILYPSGACRCG
jgi:hypothetical protein